MILAVDVYYKGNNATCAGISFKSWEQPSADDDFKSSITGIEKYIPGSFCKREMPCILNLLHEHDLHPDCIVIDGFVFLDGSSSPGLGKHLFDALKGSTPVLGVAKNPFRGISQDYHVFRGKSSKPLYITSVGIPLERAKQNILKMYGGHRIPEILRMADRLCRKCQAK